jgi:hypothetical protein
MNIPTLRISSNSLNFEKACGSCFMLWIVPVFSKIGSSKIEIDSPKLPLNVAIVSLPPLSRYYTRIRTVGQGFDYNRLTHPITYVFILPG